MSKITLFEDRTLELKATLYSGLTNSEPSLSQKICGDSIDSKIDQSCGCPNG